MAHDGPGPWPELTNSPDGLCYNWLCESLIDLALPLILGNWWIAEPAIVKEKILPMGFVTPISPTHDPSEGTMTAPDFYIGANVGIAYASDAGIVQNTLPERLYAHHLLRAEFAKQPRPSSLNTLLLALPISVGLMKLVVRPGAATSDDARERLKLGGANIEVLFHLRYPSTS